jgi:hypothetical protein
VLGFGAGVTNYFTGGPSRAPYQWVVSYKSQIL